MNSNNKLSDDTHFSRKPLTREQIEEIRKGDASLAADEMDDFDKDAAQGWSKASAGMELMQPLDKKFLAKPATMYWGIAAVLTCALAFFFLFQVNDHPKQKMAVNQPNITVDKSDVVLPKEIQQFEELPAELQIQPQHVVSNFKKKDEETEVLNVSHQASDEDIAALPLKQIQPPLSSKPNLLPTKKSAKEVYLSDFKLVDYRAYRSKPAIPSEQITLTLSGTPADMEKQEIAEDDPAWKIKDIPYHDYIRQTMEKFKSGNFKQTLNRTKSILGFYPDDINALFYGGLCYYNLSETDQAIDAFQKVIANPYNNFDEEAYWYLANAYDLKNEKTKARELFQQIANQKGYYAKQAEKMLRK